MHPRLKPRVLTALLAGLVAGSALGAATLSFAQTPPSGPTGRRLSGVIQACANRQDGDLRLVSNNAAIAATPTGDNCTASEEPVWWVTYGGDPLNASGTATTTSTIIPGCLPGYTQEQCDDRRANLEAIRNFSSTTTTRPSGGSGGFSDIPRFGGTSTTRPILGGASLRSTPEGQVFVGQPFIVNLIGSGSVPRLSITRNGSAGTQLVEAHQRRCADNPLEGIRCSAAYWLRSALIGDYTITAASRTETMTVAGLGIATDEGVTASTAQRATVDQPNGNWFDVPHLAVTQQKRFTEVVVTVQYTGPDVSGAAVEASTTRTPSSGRPSTLTPTVRSSTCTIRRSVFDVTDGCRIVYVFPGAAGSTYRTRANVTIPADGTFNPTSYTADSTTLQF